VQIDAVAAMASIPVCRLTPGRAFFSTVSKNKLSGNFLIAGLSNLEI
jgi:hypothetical protein